MKTVFSIIFSPLERETASWAHGGGGGGGGRRDDLRIKRGGNLSLFSYILGLDTNVGLCTVDAKKYSHSVLLCRPL